MLLLRLPAVFLPLFISFLFGACSKKESALLPGEIIVNASELPGPIQEWKTDSACERCLTINLDNPSLPWFRIAEGISEAYAHGVNNLRLKRGDAIASAFENGIFWDLPVSTDMAPESDPESEKDMNPDIPCLPDDAVLEHPFREDDFLVFNKTPSRKPVYPIVKFIRSPYPERGNYQLVYWRIQKKPSGPSRKNDLQVFANMANEHINQRRAFIFLIENETPCGEVFDYLNAIDGRDTLVGVTFSRENE